MSNARTVEGVVERTVETLEGETYTYEAIEALVQKDGGCFNMSLVGADATAVEAVVNRGIDAHLEACFVPERGDLYRWAEAPEDQQILYVPRLMCVVSAESMPVLLRRLYESDDDGCCLADGILELLKASGEE